MNCKLILYTSLTELVYCRVFLVLSHYMDLHVGDSIIIIKYFGINRIPEISALKS